MKLHIYGALQAYRRLRPARFHMPGHKGDIPILRDAALDVTELSLTDSLESPTGVIALAQQDVADILGAAHSYFLTDGSTCGVYCLVWLVRRRGGRVLIPRNAHRSVYAACAALGVEPVILKNNEKEGVLLPPGASGIESVFKKERDVSAVLLTSPDYFGNFADLAAIRKVCDRYGRLLLADGAHGVWARFDPDGAPYAGEWADAWVDGLHKTAPTLTQGALLNVRNELLARDAEEALGLFRTSSPSYLVMASAEYGVKALAEHGAARIDALKRELALLRTRLEKRGIRCYGKGGSLTLAADFGGAGIDAQRAQDELEKRRVFAELNDGRYLLFYFTPADKPSAVSALAGKILAVARMRALRGTYKAAARAEGVKKYGYLTALSLACEYVPLAEAAGRVAARTAGIAPPCYPVVVAGELITQEAADALANARHAFGIGGGKIAVVNIGART